MRLSSLLTGLCSITALLVSARAAEAHTSLASGPAQATKTQKITFGVGHGCEGTGGHSDTRKVRVEIPAGVTSVRPLFSDFGMPAVTRDASNNVTAIEWTKAAGDELAGDDAYYEITIRARIPDVAFTRLQFNVIQTCVSGETLRWDQPAGSSENPAPLLVVVPARTPGWNEITVGRAVAAAEMALYFSDAQIVWRGTEAFSVNANTMMQIGKTEGVTALSSGLAAGDKIWVRY